MFLGHFAVAFAAKPAAPRVSLGTLVLASQFADLLWPTLLILGVERVAVRPGVTAVTPLDFEHYPYSHSLLALVLWGAAGAALYLLVRRSRPAAGGAAALVGGLVLSHWLLDVVVHRPDLPLAFGDSIRVGMGLWNSRPATLAVELGLFGLGLWLYSRSTRARDRAGRWGLWGLAGFLAAVYVTNLLGPPPPGPAAVAWVTQSMWLLVAWGYWLDRHRTVLGEHG
jgi:hypothetical protein